MVAVTVRRVTRPRRVYFEDWNGWGGEYRATGSGDFPDRLPPAANPITIVRNYAYYEGKRERSRSNRAMRRLMEAGLALVASALFNALFISTHALVGQTVREDC